MNDKAKGWRTGVPVNALAFWNPYQGVHTFCSHFGKVMWHEDANPPPPTFAEIRAAMEPEAADSKHILVPKLTKDHPQPEIDKRNYIGWFSDGGVGMVFNVGKWSAEIIAFAGPIEPLLNGKQSLVSDPDTIEKMRMAYMAGKEAK